MSKENQILDELCQFCLSKQIFYRQLPVFREPENDHHELEKLRRFARWRKKQGELIAIHVSFLDEESHLEIIQSFLKLGKIGAPNHTSISNYFSHYVEESREKYPNDLVVAMALQEGDVQWSTPDRHGHKGAYPLLPFRSDVYGEMTVKYDKVRLITHVPPDRILGFYYVKPQQS